MRRKREGGGGGRSDCLCWIERGARYSEPSSSHARTWRIGARDSTVWAAVVTGSESRVRVCVVLWWKNRSGVRRIKNLPRLRHSLSLSLSLSFSHSALHCSLSVSFLFSLLDLPKYKPEKERTNDRTEGM